MVYINSWSMMSNTVKTILKVISYVIAAILGAVGEACLW